MYLFRCEWPNTLISKGSTHIPLKETLHPLCNKVIKTRHFTLPSIFKFLVHSDELYLFIKRMLMSFVALLDTPLDVSSDIVLPFKRHTRWRLLDCALILCVWIIIYAFQWPCLQVTNLEYFTSMSNFHTPAESWGSVHYQTTRDASTICSAMWKQQW